MFESVAESYASDTEQSDKFKELKFESVAESYASDTFFSALSFISCLRVLPNPMPQTQDVSDVFRWCLFESVAESYASDTNLWQLIYSDPFESVAESYASDT